MGLILSVSLLGCSSKGNVSVGNEGLEGLTGEEIEINVEDQDSLTNISSEEPLEKMIINGSEVDISSLTVEDLVDIADLEYQSFANSYIYVENLTFDGKGFVFGENDFTIFIQASNDGSIVSEFHPSEFEHYKIDGIKVSDFFIEEDEYNLVTFYKGIHVGMTKDEIDSILGESLEDLQDVNSNTHSYRNDKMEMIVNYGSNHGDWVVEDIYLFNN